MKRILILAVSAFCLLSAKADDDDATIRMYLHDSGYNNLSDADIAKVHAYLKANGYEHIGDVDPAVALNYVPTVAPEKPRQPVATPTPSKLVASPGKDFPPVAVHTGDTVEDALAYSKMLIPFLKTHILPGRVQEEKVGSLFLVILKAAKETGHEADLEYFSSIVTRELEAAGVADRYGNQPIK